MIKIIFIVPYEELRPVVEEALEEFKSHSEISASIYVYKSWEIRDVSFQGDVIISRGFTARMIQEDYPDVISVPLHVSGYDIIRATRKACDKFHPKKIAIIGTDLMVYHAEELNGIFDVEICTYVSDGFEQMAEVIERAKQDGCDAFIGGLSIMKFCGEGAASVMIETGKEAVIKSLDEAVRLVRQTRIERNRAAWLRTVIKHIKQGVVFLDEQGNISAANNMARYYLSADDTWIGKPGNEMLDFARQHLNEVARTGNAINSEILTVSGKMLAVDFIPAVRGHQTVGTLIFLQSVNRLQKEESIVRKKMHGKGLNAKYHFDDIFCKSQQLQLTINQAKIFSEVDSPILIVGESGTGKELMAQSIHNAGMRKDGPFIAINCAALPENLLESELFGYSDGAFTGALKGGKAGLFESAHGGSIFLDEISEVPISFQSKLLRVLQENEVRRIGSDKVLSIDTRIIAATNRNLRELVHKGEFRKDLLFRLDVLKLSIPPLRERPEDIIGLFDRYISEFSKKYHKEIAMFSSETKRLLEAYPWEGNVRELRNIAERICVLNSGGLISEEIVRDTLRVDNVDHTYIKSNEINAQELTEDEILRELLQRYDGHRGKVANHLGIDRSTLWRKLKKYKLA